MGNNQNIIELNGRRYDARSGKMLNNNAKNKAGTLPAGHVMDGVTSTAHAQSQLNKAVKKVTKAKTLMREAVKKPTPGPKYAIQDHKTHPEIIVNKPAILYQTPNHKRDLLAESVKKSHFISKFGTTMDRSTLSKKIAPLTVQPEPAAVLNTPVNLIHHTTALAKPAEKSQFAHALASASSHEQPKVKNNSKLRHRAAHKLRLSPRALNIGVGLLAILLLGGFFAYQNIPNFAMRIATTRSGVHGSLPGYQPSGFTLNGPIAYKSGEITLNFKSNSDQRNFRIIQESSSWNSETLHNSLVTNGKEPITRQKQGRTIYIYDGSNAAWVNGGVKYVVDGNSSLSNSQLLDIADSL